MTKFNIPDRKYSKKDKRQFNIRLPGDMIEEIDRVAKRKGWNATDLVSVALDQYLQWENKKR